MIFVKICSWDFSLSGIYIPLGQTLWTCDMWHVSPQTVLRLRGCVSPHIVLKGCKPKDFIVKSQTCRLFKSLTNLQGHKKNCPLRRSLGCCAPHCSVGQLSHHHLPKTVFSTVSSNSDWQRASQWSSKPDSRELRGEHFCQSELQGTVKNGL